MAPSYVSRLELRCQTRDVVADTENQKKRDGRSFDVAVAKAVMKLSGSFERRRKPDDSRGDLHNPPENTHTHTICLEVLG